jgi:hypothetical protein
MKLTVAGKRSSVRDEQGMARVAGVVSVVALSMMVGCVHGAAIGPTPTNEDSLSTAQAPTPEQGQDEVSLHRIAGSERRGIYAGQRLLATQGDFSLYAVRGMATDVFDSSGWIIMRKGVPVVVVDVGQPDMGEVAVYEHGEVKVALDFDPEYEAASKLVFWMGHGESVALLEDLDVEGAPDLYVTSEGARMRLGQQWVPARANSDHTFTVGGRDGPKSFVFRNGEWQESEQEEGHAQIAEPAGK